jgi:hypothetical protein
LRDPITTPEWTSDRIELNQDVNRIRERVTLWRQGEWQGVTPVTRKLLEHWTAPKERPLFFCQIEAVETAIYICEVVNKQGHQDAWIVNALREKAADANPGLFRVAHKMATGTGKTVVMAMLIAWQTLNKAAHKQDNRFSDAFLIVSPGITIRDRLRVLLPAQVAPCGCGGVGIGPAPGGPKSPCSRRTGADAGHHRADLRRGRRGRSPMAAAPGAPGGRVAGRVRRL